MSIPVVYRSLYEFALQWITDDCDTRVTNLVRRMYGVFQSRSVQLNRLVRKLPTTRQDAESGDSDGTVSGERVGAGAGLVWAECAGSVTEGGCERVHPADTGGDEGEQRTSAADGERGLPSAERTAGVDAGTQRSWTFDDGQPG